MQPTTIMKSWQSPDLQQDIFYKSIIGAMHTIYMDITR